jgi:hypothetical protein
MLVAALSYSRKTEVEIPRKTVALLKNRKPQT